MVAAASAFANDGVWDYIPKDPDAVLDYHLDWEDWLAGDTISAAAWTLPSGITKDSQAETDTVATIWLSGGSPGNRYFVKCHITTAAGREEDRTFRVDVRER